MPDYQGFNEKTLGNAIAHGWIPQYKQVQMCCEKCRNKDLFVLYENRLGKGEEWDQMEIFIFACPVCGSRELDVTGVYLLPEVIPDKIFQIVGGFIALFTKIYPRVQQIRAEIGDPDDE